jgi:FKBP-type peptidyl-prolyl cis-trans isomerase
VLRRQATAFTAFFLPGPGRKKVHWIWQANQKFALAVRRGYFWAIKPKQLKGIEMKFRVLVPLIIMALMGQVPAQEKPVLTDQKDKASYSIGLNVGNNLKRQDVDIDLKLLGAGLKDALAGKELLLSEEESGEVMRNFQVEHRKQQAERRRAQGERNTEEGEKFLAENQKKPGVVSLPSGLQYKVIEQGSGPAPKANDTVTVHYRGTLIDGTEFDSSHKRGQPATFGVTGVIKGWTEALQLMPTGSKWELYIPAQLAYGEAGAGTIPPNATLIFEVELLSVRPPAAPVVTQPITSDIIKVPSKEELERGAKIEIIKAEDIEREKKKQQQP